MKIERISENQIKCTLTRSDLASRQIKLSELAYGTEKTRGLFQDMMTQAENEVGFEAKDLPLMIEAIPVSMDCVILMITKVEDPDEYDAKFSEFTKLDNPEETEGQHEDLTYLLDDRSLKDLLDEVDFQITKQTASESTKAVKKSAASKATLERVFSFATLDDVIEYAHHLGGAFDGENTLYKNSADGKYYLQINRSANNVKEFDMACVSALEYGSKEPFGYARSAFFNEHFTTLVEGDAIQSLANV